MRVLTRSVSPHSAVHQQTRQSGMLVGSGDVFAECIAAAFETSVLAYRLSRLDQRSPTLAARERRLIRAVASGASPFVVHPDIEPLLQRVAMGAGQQAVTVFRAYDSVVGHDFL